MGRTNDPIDDFNMWDYQHEESLRKLPRCDYCGTELQEYLYHIDNELLCEDCMNDHYRMNVEDFIEEEEICG